MDIDFLNKMKDLNKVVAILILVMNTPAANL